MSSKACRRSFHVGDLRRADSDSDSESDLRSLNSTASLSNQLDSVPGENKESSIQESGPAKITIEDQIREYRAAKLKREITALLAWANTFLKARGFEAKDVSTDFKDGVLLINLLEATFREKVVAMYNLRPKLQAHRLDNYTHIFEFLKKNKVNTLSVDMHDMVNGKESQTVSLLWNILRRLTLKGLAALNNLDEGSIMNENASGKSAMGVKSMLKQWVNEVLSNHEEVSDVQVTDFWNSFKSGKAFAAIIGELAPGKIDLSTVDSKSAPELLREAFRIAEEELGIPSLLSPEDLLTMTDSDEKAVENYLCMLISAQNAMKQKKVEVQKIQRKLSTIEKEKDLELQKLQKNIEEEKKQFNMLQEDVQKLQDMYNSVSSS